MQKCRKISPESVNGLIQKFSRIYKFCNGHLNKFILLLRKGLYPYEDMDNWKKFDETTIPPKGVFYIKQNKEAISNSDYAHVEKVWKIFKTTNRGKYDDL